MTLERCPETSCGTGRTRVAVLQQLTASGDNPGDYARWIALGRGCFPPCIHLLYFATNFNYIIILIIIFNEAN